MKTLEDLGVGDEGVVTVDSDDYSTEEVARGTHRQMPKHSVGGEGVPLGGLMKNFPNLPFFGYFTVQINFLSEV